MTHIERLIEAEIAQRLDTPILFSVVKECGHYASILLCYLIEKQIEQVEMSDKFNVRQGRRWIPMLPEHQILEDLPIFPDVRTIDRAAEVLEDAGYNCTERTGAFLDCGQTGLDGFYTGRARDKWTWWHVPRIPDDYAQRSRISSLETAAYGFAGALILAHWRKRDSEMGDFKKLSGAELEKVLPMDEKTVRRNLTSLLEMGALVRHPKKPKLYRYTHQEITAELVKHKDRAEGTLAAAQPTLALSLSYHEPMHCSSLNVDLFDPAMLDCQAA